MSYGSGVISNENLQAVKEMCMIPMLLVKAQLVGLHELHVLRKAKRG
jgi:hypothetical protein